MESLAPLLQFLISGLTNGAIYALIALGFSIIYNATTIINFAQGEMVMLGALCAISLYHLYPSLPLAFLGGVAVVTLVVLVASVISVGSTMGATVLERSGGLILTDDFAPVDNLLAPIFSGQ